MSLGRIVLLILVTSLMPLFYSAEGSLLAVELDQKCLRMVKNNLTTNCPDYKELEKYDTTNQRLAGKFVDSTYYHREKPRVANWFVFVKDFIICVDCSAKALVHADYTITITSGSFVYKLDKDSKIINNTRYQYHDRYVDSCHDAVIRYDEFLLNDTINYFRSGCKDTQFTEQTIIQEPFTKHDISTSNAFKHQQWLKEAKKLSGTNCLKSDKC